MYSGVKKAAGARAERRLMQAAARGGKDTTGNDLTDRAGEKCRSYDGDFIKMRHINVCDTKWNFLLSSKGGVFTLAEPILIS